MEPPGWWLVGGARRGRGSAQECGGRLVGGVGESRGGVVPDAPLGGWCVCG